MIVNSKELIKAKPIYDMMYAKVKHLGVSHGLSEAGYDIRIKQQIKFKKFLGFIPMHKVDDGRWSFGNFTIASAIEYFNMPTNFVGIVHDKSTWARRGLSVFNTVIEPGWSGFLTLELVYHGKAEITIPAGCGIAQVIFNQTVSSAAYDGKYQNQEDKPVAAKESI